MTRDARHLLKFFDAPIPEAIAFRAQYARLRIVNPVAFLSEIDRPEAAATEPE